MLTRILHALGLNRSSSTTTAQTRRPRPLGLENLESRTLLASRLSATLANGILHVEGTPGNDRIIVREQGGRLAIDQVPIRVQGRAYSSISSRSVASLSIRALSGNDIVSLGQTNQEVTRPAQVFGGSGNDQILGGLGNDRLFGEAGQDALWGHAGNDGLHGGQGNDVLTGHAGADRFLWRGEDRVADPTSGDTVVRFQDVGRVWADGEVLAIDSGLARLQARTGNTRLLKLANGQGLTFERHTFLRENGAPADNDSVGRIRFADSAFSQDSEQVPNIAIHEIGHNWDDPSESPFASAFRQQSGWTRSAPTASHVRSKDGEWFYVGSSAFAREYGRTNPYEDFATCMEVAFGGRSEGIIEGKLAVLNRWLDSLRGPIATAKVDLGQLQKADLAAFSTTRREIDSVVTIRNNTPYTQTYYLMWPGYGWQKVTLRSGKFQVHYTPAGNRMPTLKYDASAAAGFQARTARLFSKLFVASRPEGWGTPAIRDGMIYDLGYARATRAFSVKGYLGLDTGKYAEQRAVVMRMGGFPNLGGGFEVIGPRTGRSDGLGGGPIVQDAYNCIAWTMGFTDRWVWPTTNPVATLLDFDALYALQGYQRLSSLDYRRVDGVQKIAVYAGYDQLGRVTVTHGALQMNDGSWTSKLGGEALIRHLTPDAVDGSLLQAGSYGVPVAVYARRA